MQHLDPRASLFFWLRYVVSFMWVPTALILLGILALTYLPDQLGTATPANVGAAIAFLFYLLAVTLLGTFAVAWIVSRSYRYELTGEEFKKESGVLFKQYVSIPYEQIQNVDITRTPIERLVGLSRLSIETAGSERPDAEGELPGLSRARAEELRTQLVERVGKPTQPSAPDATPAKA